ncbi:response regulator transcription factor [Oscillospiraceae bacterium OttesenSCG-928-G22]|nr:response regulator transcription factor [Oscillospiraceae bacterium OttesenSCG-928-G22]
MPNILVVEDEAKIARFLELELLHEGYGVKTTAFGREGLELALSGEYDLLVLDLMLPDLSGSEVLRRLRQTSPLPVIVLTAKDDISDKVAGLDLGADDYMTKPFAIEELLARIRRALKKETAKPKVSLTAGELRLDPASREVTYGGERLSLTKKEYDLLHQFMRCENTVLTRNQLLNDVWGYDYLGDTNVVDVYVRYLRQKIDEKYGEKFIHTIRGVGYLFRLEES